MADFNITDRYSQQIEAVQGNEGLDSLFPLLSRIPKSSGDVLQMVDLQGFPLAKVQGEADMTLEVDEQTYKTLTIQGFGFGIELRNAGNLTAGGVQNALETVRNTLYETIEAHLLWGRVHSSIAKSEIRGAVLKKNSADKFSQSGNDILFVQENDFAPVVDGITKIETLAFKHFNTEGENEFTQILVNPYKGILLGDLTPQFKITQDLRSNTVVVFGTVSVAGGFFTDGAIKTYGGTQ